MREITGGPTPVTRNIFKPYRYQSYHDTFVGSYTWSNITCMGCMSTLVCKFISGVYARRHRSKLMIRITWGLPREYIDIYIYIGGSRGLVVKMLDSKFEGCEFKTHTGHGSFSKLRQFRLPYFASVYSAANEYKHCLEGTCDGLVSRPGESV